jgi:hypothetical protein
MLSVSELRVSITLEFLNSSCRICVTTSKLTMLLFTAGAATAGAASDFLLGSFALAGTVKIEVTSARLATALMTGTKLIRFKALPPGFL